MKEAYDKGLAVGIQQIRSDSILFRFKDELWEFPAFYVLGVNGKNIAKFNGNYYEAKPSRLRGLAKRMKRHG